MRAQISRSDALKIGYKVMNKHPKSLFIKEVLHMIYFQHVCWLVAHFFKTKRVKNKLHTPEQSGHRFRHYPDTLSVLIRTPIPG